MSTGSHDLKDKWFVSYLPLLTKEVVSKQYGGDWYRAAQEKTHRLDYVSTVEELWSTVNSLPHIHQLGVGSTYIFSRCDKQPSFEAFPDGSRVTFKLMTSPATDKGLDIILAVILGESLNGTDCGFAEELKKAEGSTSLSCVCDVIRICGRQNRDFPNLLQLEVWVREKSYSNAIAESLCKLLIEQGVPETSFSASNSDFE